MKQGVSFEAKSRVIDLRRRCSIREVAEQTGLPVGTVKTICSRSGAFRDNKVHRALFSLPPIHHSSQTLPAVPELPPQQRVTGDKEVDAVLWLRQVIGTGQAALIEKAMEGAKKIKTPLKEVEKRYRDWLTTNQPGNLFAALSSFDFADLEGLAKKSIQKAARQHEARSRFGDDLFAETPAESFCVTALHGLKPDNFGWFTDTEADERFARHAELLPNTLTDCLHELAYWRDLYHLRNSVDIYLSDGPSEAYARRQFVFRSLGLIRARDKAEAVAVLRHLIDDCDSLDDEGTDAILLNLIG